MIKKLKFLINLLLINYCNHIIFANLNFPYGAPPEGNVCIWDPNTNYATPETMFGSWALKQALQLDLAENNLSDYLSSLAQQDRLAYAVGTAAIGHKLGIDNCSSGCDELNGSCYLLEFVGDHDYNKPIPTVSHVLLQSVNIGANINTFDIYMPGGGTGAFPKQCAPFWGSSNKLTSCPESCRQNKNQADCVNNWACHIQDWLSGPLNIYQAAEFCAQKNYFDFTDIKANYKVTYDNIIHDAETTLYSACVESVRTGIAASNWKVNWTPVTCPKYLTQITGIKKDQDNFYNIKQLTSDSYKYLNSEHATWTTQMQDCNPPSSSYCHKPGQERNSNYVASIAATIAGPRLTPMVIPPPDNNPEDNKDSYCYHHIENSKFCSWDLGHHGNDDWCSVNIANCHSCSQNNPATPAKWCACLQDHKVSCQATNDSISDPDNTPDTNPDNNISNYCQIAAVNTEFCSWDNGDHTGGDWCNAGGESRCKSCGGSPLPKWCKCSESHKAIC